MAREPKYPQVGEDYYRILRVNPMATQEEIKDAYRALVRQFHPDVNHGLDAPEVFRSIQDAFDVLSDTEKRADYDRSRHGVNFPNDQRRSATRSFFSDALSSAQGGGEAFRSLDLEISADEARRGTSRELLLPTEIACSDCFGRGFAKKATLRVCPECGGEGQKSFYRGAMPFSATCATCFGIGKTSDSPCTRCQGRGIVLQDRKISVTIPAGAQSGDVVRLPVESLVRGKRKRQWIEVVLSVS